MPNVAPNEASRQVAESMLVKAPPVIWASSWPRDLGAAVELCGLRCDNQMVAQYRSTVEGSTLLEKQNISHPCRSDWD